MHLYWCGIAGGVGDSLESVGTLPCGAIESKVTPVGVLYGGEESLEELLGEVAYLKLAVVTRQDTSRA